MVTWRVLKLPLPCSSGVCVCLWSLLCLSCMPVTDGLVNSGLWRCSCCLQGRVQQNLSQPEESRPLEPPAETPVCPSWVIPFLFSVPRQSYLLAFPVSSACPGCSAMLYSSLSNLSGEFPAGPRELVLTMAQFLLLCGPEQGTFPPLLKFPKSFGNFLLLHPTSC